MAEKKGIKVVAQNRKAFHDYFVEDRYEAGIELKGTEVKSIRAGTLNLKDSYVIIKNGEANVLSMHISPYDKGNIFNHDPDRPKKLLLKNHLRKNPPLLPCQISIWRPGKRGVSSPSMTPIGRRSILGRRQWRHSPSTWACSASTSL